MEVNEYFEIEKDGIVYIPAMKVTEDKEEGGSHQIWKNTPIQDITDPEVKQKALEIWTTGNIRVFKDKRN